MKKYRFYLCTGEFLGIMHYPSLDVLRESLVAFNTRFDLVGNRVYLL